MNIVQLSEDEFFQWIKMQLEKREVRIGRPAERERAKAVIYEVLFYEQGLTVEEIELFFIPFGQAGYLTPRQKFEIMLFVLEKDYGSGLLFLEGIENYCILTGEDIEEIYLQWLLEERLFLSEEEKKEFFVQNILDKLTLGILEVLMRVAPDGILVGEFCPCFHEKERIEERIAVCSNGAIIRLPFLNMQNQEELMQMIRRMLAMENQGELTMLEPVLDFVKEDGTCITAVRPPVGQEWGLRILYGAGRKGEAEWKKQLVL